MPRPFCLVWAKLQTKQKKPTKETSLQTQPLDSRNECGLWCVAYGGLCHTYFYHKHICRHTLHRSTQHYTHTHSTFSDMHSHTFNTHLKHDQYIAPRIRWLSPPSHHTHCHPHPACTTQQVHMSNKHVPCILCPYNIRHSCRWLHSLSPCDSGFSLTLLSSNLKA